MSADLLPTADHVLDVGVRRAIDALRAGRPVAEVERILIVAGVAAELIQTDAPGLDR